MSALGCPLTRPVMLRRSRLVGAGGLEPLTSSVSGRRSNQLSYAPIRDPSSLRRTLSIADPIGPSRDTPMLGNHQITKSPDDPIQDRYAAFFSANRSMALSRAGSPA